MIYETSNLGIQFIAAREALVKMPYSDGEYADGTPRWSQGYGGPSTQGHPAITPEQALSDLRIKVKEFEADVNRALKGTLVTQPMFDALVSLYYETGAGHKENLRTALQKGDILGARDEIMKFNTNKGKYSPGVDRRRRYECDIFLRGNYGDLSHILVWDTNDLSVPPQRLPMPNL